MWNPNHSIPNVTARVTQCKITNVNDDGTAGDMKIYPIHTFDPSGNTCYDQRLNVQEGDESMSWTFRTFRTDLT